MPSSWSVWGRSAGLVSRSGSSADLTGAFTLVTQTSAPGNELLFPTAQAPGWNYVSVVATLVQGRTTAARLTTCFGDVGLGHEFDQLILPDMGLQVVLDEDMMRGTMAGPLSFYVADVADASVILLKPRMR